MNIRSLGYAFIESTDPSEWREFGVNVLGMMEAKRGTESDSVYLRIDERPFRFAIVPGKENRLQLLGLELYDRDEFEPAIEKLEGLGVALTRGTPAELKVRGVIDLIRFSDPAGNVLELYYGADLDYAKFVSPLGVSGFQTGFNGDQGFGHAVLPAPNLDETHRFYREVLGLGDTDYMHLKYSDDPEDAGLALRFMHVNNPRHHSLALFGGESVVGCVHLMLEVNTVDEVGECLDRVLAREIPITSTLGRHTNDRMLSFYMVTPASFSLEYGCDGLQMDWDNYTPTKTTLPSLWGHKFGI
ncbi:MAG TPA: biphenyl 2,3-dioxygenase [Gammaproteobacteria bacterium]|nr:biphenyl 2,3-dioxygenase [Gammaproteobacteria bacterium]